MEPSNRRKLGRPVTRTHTKRSPNGGWHLTLRVSRPVRGTATRKSQKTPGVPVGHKREVTRSLSSVTVTLGPGARPRRAGCSSTPAGPVRPMSPRPDATRRLRPQPRWRPHASDQRPRRRAGRVAGRVVPIAAVTNEVPACVFGHASSLPRVNPARFTVNVGRRSRGGSEQAAGGPDAPPRRQTVSPAVTGAGPGGHSWGPSPPLPTVWRFLSLPFDVE